MDFSLSSELQELQQRTRSFIRDKIMPLEGDPLTPAEIQLIRTWITEGAPEN